MGETQNNSDATQEDVIEQPLDEGTGQVDPSSTPEVSAAEEKLTLESIRKSLLPDLVEGSRRVIQSELAKSQNQLSTKVQQQITKGFEALKLTAKAAGLTDAQVRAAQDQIVREVYANADEVEAQPQSEFDNQPQVHPIVYAAIGMMNKGNMIVEEGDPEFDTYIKPHLGPNVDETILTQTALAMEAKKKRIAEAKEKSKIRSTGGRGAVAPQNDISTVTDSKQLYQMGEANLRRR